MDEVIVEGEMSDSGGISTAGAGGMLGALSTGIGNRRALKHSNRNFNATMAYNERMANTQYQRAVKDMMAAGLNPMLAYSQGGNSAASVSQPQTINETAGIAEGINQAVAQRQQDKIVNAQVAKTTAETDLVTQQAKLAAALVPTAAQNAANSAEQLIMQMEKLGHEVNTALHQADLAKGQASQQAIMAPLQAQYQAIMNQKEKLGLTQAELEAKFFEKVPQAKWLQMTRQTIFGGK